MSDSPVLSPKQAALFLEVSTDFLAARRVAGTPAAEFIQHFKVGAAIRYRKEDLLAWLNARRVATPAAGAGRPSKRDQINARAAGFESVTDWRKAQLRGESRRPGRPRKLAQDLAVKGGVA